MDAAATVAPVACADHPDRPAYARCMSCHRVLCQECATQWDGIHYCRRCLEARGAARGTRAAWFPSLVLFGLVLGLCLVHTRVLLWMGVLLATFF